MSRSIRDMFQEKEYRERMTKEQVTILHTLNARGGRNGVGLYLI